MRIFGDRRPCEMRLDLVGEPMHVDDRPLDAVLGQAVEGMIDERPAADLDQRLRQRLGDRPHPHPSPAANTMAVLGTGGLIGGSSG